MELLIAQIYGDDNIFRATDDYAGFFIDKKNTLGMTYFLGSSPISWETKKKNSLALFTDEVEYEVATFCGSDNNLIIFVFSLTNSSYV